MHWTDEEYAQYLAKLRQKVPGMPAPESERAFQSRVVREAIRLGYRVYHPYRSDKSTPGWFDLALARADDKLVLCELKTAGGKQTAAQRDWFHDLQRIDHVDTYLWRPRDFDALCQILARRRPRDPS